MRSAETETPRYQAMENAVTCEFNKGLAILNLDSNFYYSVNAVGAHIWQTIQQPQTVQQMVDAVCRRYDVSESRCRADVEILLEGLIENGLAIRCYDEEFA